MQDQHVVIRPAAFAPEQAAAMIVAGMRENDVSRGGKWRATVSHWERYDQPWRGADDPGESQLLGAVSVMYDRPWKHQIVVYRVRTTVLGLTTGWDAESLVDDALAFAGLSLANCPRTDFDPPPTADPFRRRRNPDYPVADGPMHPDDTSARQDWTGATPTQPEAAPAAPAVPEAAEEEPADEAAPASRAARSAPPAPERDSSSPFVKIDPTTLQRRDK